MPRGTKASRKGKKAWRRNIDVEEAEDAVHAKVVEQHVGVPEDQPDSKLFFEDLPAVSSKEQRKLAARDAIPTYELATVPNANVPPARTRRPRGKRARPSAFEQKVDKIVAKATQQNTSLAVVPASSVQKSAAADTDDLWGDESQAANSAESGALAPYIEPNNVLDRLRKRARPLRSGEASRRAVEVAHAGASYNPSFNDHQDLLAQAVADEMSRLDKDAELSKKVNKEAITKPVTLAEMFEVTEENQADTSDDEHDQDAENSNNNDLDLESGNAAAKRKTKAQRNRELRLREEERQKEKEREERRMRNQLNSIKAIRKDVDAREERIAARNEERKTAAAMRGDRVARLGPRQFQEPAKDVLLTDELPGSIRLLATKGHILKDRYVSMQRRGLLETRVKKAHHRRYKKKMYNKRSTRMADSEYFE